MTRNSMDRRRFLTGLAAVGGAAAFPGWLKSGRTESSRFPASRALAARYIAERKFANAVIAVGRADGEPVFISLGTYEIGGEGPAVGPDTLYRLYSMTKPVTGIAAMLLVEDGSIGLDQPLYDIFPAYRRTTVLLDPAGGLDSRPAEKPILIRHLLTHTSGLTCSIMGNPLAKAYAVHGIFGARMSEAAEKRAPMPATLEAMAVEAAKLPLLFEPGTKWGYSIGLDVLGAVIEKVTGTSFDGFLRTRLFEPLGMDDIFFRVPPEKLANLPPNYNVIEGREPQKFDVPPDTVYARESALCYGGSGLVSSARSYAKFDRMLLNEGTAGPIRIMKKETVRTAMSNLMAPGVFGGWGSARHGFGAGGRSVLADEPGGFSKGAWGWDGAFSTTAWVDPARGFYAMLMTQIPKDAYSLEPKFVQAVYQDLG